MKFATPFIVGLALFNLEITCVTLNAYKLKTTGRIIESQYEVVAKNENHCASYANKHDKVANGFSFNSATKNCVIGIYDTNGQSEDQVYVCADCGPTTTTTTTTTTTS